MKDMRIGTWWLLAGTLVALLCIVVFVGFAETLETLWLRESRAPRLEATLGFKAREIHPNPAFPDSAFVITEVLPSGPFAAAGFRVGDRPWDQHGRNELAFYQRLGGTSGSVVTIPVTRMDRGADIPKLVEIQFVMP